MVQTSSKLQPLSGTPNSTNHKDKPSPRNVVSLLITHTKFCHLPQSHAAPLSYPPMRPMVLQRIKCLPVSHQSRQQVFRHTIRILKHKICCWPLLPLSALCCNSQQDKQHQVYGGGGGGVEGWGGGGVEKGGRGERWVRHMQPQPSLLGWKAPK